jgi:prepilin-type N-terminal cleavage/methylation domain-containing protein
MRGCSPNAPPGARRRLQAGFSLVEALVVVGLIGVLTAIAVLVMPIAIQSATADSGATRVASALRIAREQAISQRRTVQVAFNAPNQIVVSRLEVPGPGTTVLSTTVLEDGIGFRLFAGVPDTPDAFGNATATAFGGAGTVAFSSEGTFMDQNGDPVNGTVFLGKEGQTLSARAVTIFGPTALVREWRWTGNQWGN